MGLWQLVEAELLYQQGLPPRATYRFKHALLQEVAYQSLLKSTRQQYHQRIAQRRPHRALIKKLDHHVGAIKTFICHYNLTKVTA